MDEKDMKDFDRSRKIEADPIIEMPDYGASFPTKGNSNKAEDIIVDHEDTAVATPRFLGRVFDGAIVKDYQKVDSVNPPNNLTSEDMKPPTLGSEAQLSATQGPSVSVDRKQKKNDTAILPEDFFSKNQGPVTSALTSRSAAHWDSSSAMNGKQQDTDNARLSRDFDLQKVKSASSTPTSHSKPIHDLEAGVHGSQGRVYADHQRKDISHNPAEPATPASASRSDPRLEPRTELYREQSHAGPVLQPAFLSARKENLATSNRVPHLTISQGIKAASMSQPPDGAFAPPSHPMGLQAPTGPLSWDGHEAALRALALAGGLHEQGRLQALAEEDHNESNGPAFIPPPVNDGTGRATALGHALRAYLYGDYENPYRLIGDGSGIPPDARKVTPLVWVNNGDGEYLLPCGFVKFRVQQSNIDGHFRFEKLVPEGEDDGEEESFLGWIRALIRAALTGADEDYDSRTASRVRESELTVHAGDAGYTETDTMITSDTLEGCLRGASRWITENVDEGSLGSVQREVSERYLTATEAQLQRLRQLGFDTGRYKRLTRGQATNIIVRLNHGAGERWEERVDRIRRVKKRE
ncbi:hypothetical protein BC939DRAFT_248062 [Gamsiella multidivaricata]|uniref:uncharacterized protein n=1 Tax=Gamsiella multidivaricata TaxID=101098 RepID=UPI00221F6497|nr:uncharacterized protein BC939DRAFT_248062 [Gamsiella multidivaricata]KAI7819789.1 hypothetical protein BC939DRAFT_248062 [Gamsiella multidivaricata]